MIKEISNKIAKKIPLLTYLLPSDQDESIRRHMLAHRNVKKYPKLDLVATNDIKPTKQDLLLTVRLIKAYKKAMYGQKVEKYASGLDIWSFLAKGPHAEFIKLLQKEDIGSIAFYLCNMSKMGITHGITQGEIEYKKITSDSNYRRWLTLFSLDKLLSLAEALGVTPYENPEQRQSGLYAFPDTVLPKIEASLRIPIIPPNIEGGLFKLKTKRGCIHSRDIMSLYTAWRCKEILKDVKNPSICEIGPGIGKSAYYAYLMGIKSYTLIDLPHINVLQGFYLIKCLPSANIVLYGEMSKTKNNLIRILPDWSLSTVPDKAFDLSLNQDSFAEIDKQTVIDYLRQTRVHTKKYFLSINQESQNTMMIGELRQNIVSKLVSEVKGFKQIYRFPYWLREGSVE